MLIHGAWHGAWCWNKVIPELEFRGHQVITIDLPSHGDDKTPANSVDFDNYVATITNILDSQSDKVLLLGHSMGGIPITAAAECRPAKIKCLIYLAAILAQNGESIVSIEQANLNPSLLPESLVISKDGETATVEKEVITELFYHDCTDEDIAYAKENLKPQALKIFNTVLELSENNYGSISRNYIVCLDDRAIYPEFQQSMISASPCQSVYYISSGHSPFFSHPKKLINILSEVAKNID